MPSTATPSDPVPRTGKGKSEPQARRRIIDTVIGLLESGGYDAVQLREVARRSNVSLRTIYGLFGNRAELIVVALEHWLADNSFAPAAEPAADETLYDGLMRSLRQVFEPWERSPAMLTAFHRAQTGPGGDRLDLQGHSSVQPLTQPLFADLDPALVADIELILSNLAFAVIGRFTNGQMPISEILPTLERAVFRLTDHLPGAGPRVSAPGIAARA
jgi:TetR/AcrR family transcriptional regulator, cholesterol catabolism regulator